MGEEVAGGVDGEGGEGSGSGLTVRDSMAFVRESSSFEVAFFLEVPLAFAFVFPLAFGDSGLHYHHNSTLDPLSP